MAVLNESLEIDDLQQAKEFVGNIEKRLLDVNTMLCKRVTAGKGYNRNSPWWMLKSDWDAQQGRAISAGIHPGLLARAQQAVRDDWQDNLDQPVYGQLMLPVYGFVGKTRWQPLRTGDRKVVYIGGGMQVCIPNLTQRHIRVMHPVPA